MIEGILDKGSIELLDTMPSLTSQGALDFAVVQAARVTHLEGSKGDEKDERLIHYLMRMNHTSPFEMVEFKWRIKAPLVVWWQWVRHRTFQFQSVNSQSGRYTPFEEGEFYVPANDEWRMQSSVNHQGSDGFADGEIFLKVLRHLVEDNQKTELLRDFVIDEATPSELLGWYYRTGFQFYSALLKAGIAKEQARLFLPAFGVYYTWLVKIDLHNLFSFLTLRLADDAQDEIFFYAKAMARHVAFNAPMCWNAFMDYKILPMEQHYSRFLEPDV